MKNVNLTSEQINTAVTKVNKRFKDLLSYGTHTNKYVVQHTGKKNEI